MLLCCSALLSIAQLCFALCFTALHYSMLLCCSILHSSSSSAQLSYTPVCIAVGGTVFICVALHCSALLSVVQNCIMQYYSVAQLSSTQLLIIAQLCSVVLRVFTY